MKEITIKELKIGDVFTRKGKYLYPHVVTHIDSISGYGILMRITNDWINKIDGCYLEDCVEVLVEETEIYRFIIVLYGIKTSMPMKFQNVTIFFR